MERKTLMQDLLKRYRELVIQECELQATIGREVALRRREEHAMPGCKRQPRDMSTVHSSIRMSRKRSAIAMSINTSDAEAVAAFASLLDDEVTKVQAGADLLEIIGVTGPLAERAVMIIRTRHETRIAHDVQAYLMSHAAADAFAMEESARSLCWFLENLLSILIRSRRECKWEFWCDGVIECSETVISASELALVGVAVFGPDGSNWMGPIVANFTLDTSGESLKSYDLQFGAKDTTGSLVRVPLSRSVPEREYIMHNRPRRREDWWFTFSQ